MLPVLIEPAVIIIVHVPGCGLAIRINWLLDNVMESAFSGAGFAKDSTAWLFDWPVMLPEGERSDSVMLSARSALVTANVATATPSSKETGISLTCPLAMEPRSPPISESPLISLARCRAGNR